MAVTNVHPKPAVEKLRSVLARTQHGLTKPLAEAILNLDFPDDEVDRMDELSVKANEGTLTSEETVELQSYIDVETQVAYWQAKSRQFLRSTE
jgi:hypothetical protein